MKEYNLVYAKRALCNIVSSFLIAGMLLIVYITGKHYELYLDKYQTLFYLSLVSIIVLPILDYITALYFNHYKNEFIAIDQDKIKIKSTLLFKNSGSQTIEIKRDQIKSISLKYEKLPCLERVVINYDDAVLTLFKKDFKAQEFEAIYKEIKVGT